jgi:hypothetical protein
MDQSHRIWQSNGSAAHVARFVEPPVRAGSIARLPLRKQVALGLLWPFWLFLQSNNSQYSNCQVRNTRISTASVTPMLGIPAKRHVGPFKADVVTCSIRCTSGSVLPTALPAVFAICTQITAIAPARPIAQRSPSALSRSSMRREHCGNFSVANIVMNAEVLQRAGVTPAPKGGACSVLSCSRGNCSPGHAVVLHARAAQSSERKVLKVRGLHLIA